MVGEIQLEWLISVQRVCGFGFEGAESVGCHRKSMCLGCEQTIGVVVDAKSWRLSMWSMSVLTCLSRGQGCGGVGVVPFPR